MARAVDHDNTVRQAGFSPRLSAKNNLAPHGGPIAAGSRIWQEPMEITRKTFDEQRLVLMDEIAVLVLATQTLRASGEAFENTEDIRADRTYDTAKPLFQFLERTALNLLQATLAGKTRRARMAASIHKKSGKKLTELMPNIEKLAKQEIAIYEDGDKDRAPSGTNIRDLVLGPLRQLESAWSPDQHKVNG
jgi:hypothetical protein